MKLDITKTPVKASSRKLSKTWTFEEPQHPVFDDLALSCRDEIDAEFIFTIRRTLLDLTHCIDLHRDHARDDATYERVDAWLREYCKDLWERHHGLVAFKSGRDATLFTMFWG